ncbi:DNA repair protein RecN [Thalassobacillus sp. CUG 92003]|uniref:DNA repair protein RecN n=1 Tax=Thalassobacillus sp. CUG 92003 TaxID=2736641 RepID=UPI0015E73E6B
MLTELSIRDFAIIDEVSVTFKEGLTVLTGETGAGKSIIIDAIQLLSGGRGSVEYVRHGTKRAEIEGLFTVEDHHMVIDVAQEFGVEIGEDRMIVLHRSITHQGKSICRINGKLVTLGILKEFGRVLIDIHSQHETQSLMEPERHIELLDMFAGEALYQAKRDYHRVFDHYQTLVKRYRELSENEQEMAQRLDLLDFQLKELQSADLEPQEDEKLAEERNKLANFEKLFQSVQDAYHALYGEQKGLDWISHALSALETSNDVDAELSEMTEELSNYYYLMEEMTFKLSQRMEALEFDPDRLNEIEGRLNEINRLKKKYGQSVEEILEYAAKIEEEIDEIKNKDSHLSKLHHQIEESGKDAFLDAKHLHDIRTSASDRLAQHIHEELKDLYLDKAEFDVHITHKEGKQDQDPEWEGSRVKLTPSGFDHIRFLISTNPGEPLKELHKVASGGETSRIMLALKRIFSKHQGVTSVIFDEVDTGVSGRVAQAIAEKIYGIAEGSQVLCISHLPQVASMADTHLRIEKDVTENHTSTHVVELSSEEKTDEISRMITGAELTDTTREHAKELLQLAAKHKA